MRGTGPRATVKEARRPGHRSAGACPPRSLPHPGHPVHPGHPASDVIDIKVLTDLFSLLRRRSIDIKVRWTCSRVLVAAVVRGPVPRQRFSCRNQDGQDEQDLQDGAARASGPKVWKTLMSIDISRNKEKRSERTLMCPRLGSVRGAGPRTTGGPRPL